MILKVILVIALVYLTVYKPHRGVSQRLGSPIGISATFVTPVICESSPYRPRL